jgi:membrane protein YdbS with pleckstrin-like domain
VRALGYLDGAQELVTASGIMFRSVTTTPYGRVQSVEINEGPIERHFGIATLSVSTAADSVDASISGLPRAEAERLRDLLTHRGIERMQSL